MVWEDGCPLPFLSMGRFLWFIAKRPDFALLIKSASGNVHLHKQDTLCRWIQDRDWDQNTCRADRVLEISLKHDTQVTANDFMEASSFSVSPVQTDRGKDRGKDRGRK